MKAIRTETPNLTIVGAGRVGRAVVAAAAHAGLEATLVGREREPEALANADVVLICTPDAEIAAVAAAIAAEINPGAVVGHTSGATPLSALDPAARSCSGAFGLHPLQTIPAGDTPLEGVPCAISASRPEAGDRARDLASRLGMKPFTIDENDRAAYHAAATIASNFLFALEESAAALLGQAGVSEPRKALTPLALASARNWAEHGGGALTGPIARGDEETTERHLAAISERAPELLPLYEALADRTRAIASKLEVVA